MGGVHTQDAFGTFAEFMCVCVCLLTQPLSLLSGQTPLSFTKKGYKEKVEDSRHTCITPSSLSPSGVLTGLIGGNRGGAGITESIDCCPGFNLI